MRRPNLLVVFADQLRADAVGCYGNGVVRTPNLDRLAGEGVLCENAIANYPVCGPMRAGMWTGTHPATHGVVGNDLAVRTDLPTLGTCLRDVGYRAGYVGKWHLDGVPRSKFTPPGPRRLGFDDDWAAYNCAHDYFRPYYFCGDDPTRHEVDGYEPRVMTDLALSFIDAADDRPWALVLSLGPPHDPYPQVPEHYRDLYDPATLPLRPNVEPEIDNPLAKGLDCRRTTADYYAATTALDDEVGRLLAAAESDTLVVFTSDHGDMLWSHGLMKKQSPYEESIRVPLIARGPMLPRGERVSGLVGLTDLTPTLLGLLDVDVPASMQGQDLNRVLHGDGGTDALLIANPFSTDEAVDQDMPEWRGLRTTTQTYVETLDGPWLFFDNAADPYQQHNLIDSIDTADWHRRLRSALAAADDPFVSGVDWLDRLGLADAWADRERRVWQ